MRDMRPLALLALSLALNSAKAQSSDHAKILDIQAFSRSGPPVAFAVGDVPIVLPTSSQLFTVTIRIDDIVYSAEFPNSRKLRSSAFIVGDSLKATIDHDKMLVLAPSGKEIKGKLLRRERRPEPSV